MRLFLLIDLLDTTNARSLESLDSQTADLVPLGTAPTRFPPPLNPDTATVCVIMPVRNEESTIPTALDSVINQTFDPERTEILVVDGRSEDRTIDVVTSIAQSIPRLQLVTNAAKTAPSGLNLGLKATKADVIVRVDGHARLAPDYVEQSVNSLVRFGAANAGGPMSPAGKGLVGEAMALALCSRFGIGDSRFHFSDRMEFVDSVYLGSFRRCVLEEVGGFDETLITNEDFELNHRIRRAGYGVLLSPTIHSAYFPRASIPAIWTQFYRYGQGKASVMLKHPRSVQPRHLAAPALIGALAVSLTSLCVTRRRWTLFPWMLYGLAVAVASLLTAGYRRITPVLSIVYATMHLSWGLGVLVKLGRSLRVTFTWS